MLRLVNGAFRTHIRFISSVINTGTSSGESRSWSSTNDRGDLGRLYRPVSVSDDVLPMFGMPSSAEGSLPNLADELPQQGVFTANYRGLTVASESGVVSLT